MIEPLVDAVRRLVVVPQTLPEVPADRRLYLSLDGAPLKVALQAAEVVPVSSTPIAPELGNAPTVTIRHVITVGVGCESDTLAHAADTRNRILTDLMRRVLLVDWTNDVDLPAEQELATVTWTVDYPDLDPGSLAAWATLTLTVDVEWSVA